MTDRDKQIAELYREGKSQREIGRTLGISHVAVGKILRKLAVVTSNGTPSPEQPPSIEDIQEIHSLAESLTRVGNPCSPAFVRSQGHRLVSLAEQILQGVKKG